LATAGGLALSLAFSVTGNAAGPTNWPQWGQNPQHQGFVDTAGQSLTSILDDVTVDPFVPQEQADQDGELLAHYPVPIVQENDVWMSFKTGTYTAILPDGSNLHTHWNSQIWNYKRLHWEGTPATLVEKWIFQSDWKPEPNDFTGWEPVFHGVSAGGFLYVPGAGGRVYKLDKGAGTLLNTISPFGAVDPNTFVASPLSADDSGNVYYNALKMTDTNALVDSWLVRIGSDDSVSTARYTDLISDAPTTCVTQFSYALTPLPPGPPGTGPTAAADPNRLPASAPCGAQRPGVNVTPAIAPDGTIYTASRAHRNSRYAYLVAVNPDLTPKWAASLRNRLNDNDGCGSSILPTATALFPANPTAADVPTFRSRCRFGATAGVDPQTNEPPAGRILDDGTASPTVLPDGSVLFGTYTRYNIARGHLMKFTSSGSFQGSYDFGWDDTLGVYQHDGTYSIVMKDNHYDEESGYYCFTATPFSRTGSLTARSIFCDWTGIPAGPFYITQVNPNLVTEWKFHNTNTQSCTRNPDGSITCVSDHPGGFEWCVNAPLIDRNGVVYANSEDGNLYSIDQGHSGVFTTPKQKIFQNIAIGAAYTPASMDAFGRIYSQNDGHLFVIGTGGRGVGHGGGHGGLGHGPKRPPEGDDPTDAG
jgi:hypothetical protein